MKKEAIRASTSVLDFTIQVDLAPTPLECHFNLQLRHHIVGQGHWLHRDSGQERRSCCLNASTGRHIKQQVNPALSLFFLLLCLCSLRHVALVIATLFYSPLLASGVNALFFFVLVIVYVLEVKALVFLLTDLLHEVLRWLVVHRREQRDILNQPVEQLWLERLGVIRNSWFL